MLQNETDRSYQANLTRIDEWIKKLEEHPRSVDGLQISPERLEVVWQQYELC